MLTMYQYFKYFVFDFFKLIENSGIKLKIESTRFEWRSNEDICVYIHSCESVQEELGELILEQWVK